MAKFLFVLGSGMESPSKATRCMQLASVAKEDGHDVNVFLVDDAVFFAVNGLSDNIRAATGDEMKQHMDKLIAAEVPIYA
jgi:predicted peroxiredoxin